jgi:hypothetical protein
MAVEQGEVEELDRHDPSKRPSLRRARQTQPTPPMPRRSSRV